MITLDITLLSGIVIALTEIIKRALKVPTNWQPALAVGLAIGIGGTTAFWGFTDLTLGEALFAGLAASGFWDLGKKPVVSISKAILGK